MSRTNCKLLAAAGRVERGVHWLQSSGALRSRRERRVGCGWAWGLHAGAEDVVASVEDVWPVRQGQLRRPRLLVLFGP